MSKGTSQTGLKVTPLQCVNPFLQRTLVEAGHAQAATSQRSQVCMRERAQRLEATENTLQEEGSRRGWLPCFLKPGRIQELLQSSSPHTLAPAPAHSQPRHSAKVRTSIASCPLPYSVPASCACCWPARGAAGRPGWPLQSVSGQSGDRRPPSELAPARLQMKATFFFALAALCAVLASAQGALPALIASSQARKPQTHPCSSHADCSSLAGTLANDCQDSLGSATSNQGLAGSSNSTLSSAAASSSITSTCCKSFQTFLSAVRRLSCGRPFCSLRHSDACLLPAELQVQHQHRVPAHCRRLHR